MGGGAHGSTLFQNEDKLKGPSCKVPLKWSWYIKKIVFIAIFWTKTCKYMFVKERVEDKYIDKNV